MNTCLSQVLLADTTKAAILPKPTSMSFVEAGALPLVFATAATILSAPYTILPVTSPGSCPTTPTIVVLGGSTAVGIFAIQHAVRKLGARVITTCSSRNTDFVKSLGAELVIDYTSESVRDRLLELCPSEGFISIVDCVGGRELVSDSSVLSKLIAPRSLSYKMGGNFVTIVGDKSPTDRNSM